MKTLSSRAALSLTALSAALVLAACGRDERIPVPADSTAANGSANSSAPTTTAANSANSTDSATGSPNAAITSNPPGAIGTASTAPLPAADAQFVSKAAEGGQFEVEVAKLAADKASDSQVKSFAQMLLDDHNSANEKLRQIASSHGVALPASLPDDKKKQIDDLGKLSGADFDKQFVKVVGLKDHQHDIADFEKASKTAQSEDVKSFAQQTLPTLKKHLAAAEKLPAKG